MDFLIKLLIEFWPFWVGVAVVLALILLLRMYGGPQRLPYQKRDSLITKSELRFYKSLQKAVQDDFEIFAMVRIADLLRVDGDSSQKRKWLNKILAKHIDFVLCDPGSLEPLICIELDDVSHDRPDRVERDIFVNQAFASANLPLLRIPTQPTYLAREIRTLIDNVRKS